MGLRRFVRRLGGDRETGRPAPLQSPNVPAPNGAHPDPYDLDAADGEPADYDDGVSEADGAEDEAPGPNSDAG